MNPSPDPNRSHDAAKAWCVLLVLSGCVLLFAFKTRECFVDDAYIGFQYVDNLTAGQGFVFHAGDKPIEGTTNIGWLLLLGPLTTLAPPAVAAKLLGLALVMFVLTLLVAVGRVFAMKEMWHGRPRPCCPSDTAESGCATGDSFVLAVVPAVLLTASFDFVYFSTAGMETALLAAILMTVCCTALFRPTSLWLPTLVAAASLVHPEAALVYPIYVLLRWPRANDDRRRLIVGALLWSAILGLIMAARWGYFGDVVPNTFHSKPSNLQLTIQNIYGFLMVSNCCGRKAFDKSFREMVAKLYPDDAFKALPRRHPIYTGKVGQPLGEVRYRKILADELKSRGTTRPPLEAVVVKGRTVLVYSKYDWCCGLEKDNPYSSRGYVEADALKLAMNIVLYAISY